MFRDTKPDLGTLSQASTQITLGKDTDKHTREGRQKPPTLSFLSYSNSTPHLHSALPAVNQVWL